MADFNPFLHSPFQQLIDKKDPEPLMGQQAVKETATPDLSDVPTDAAPAAPTPASPRAANLLPPESMRPLFEATASHFNVPVNVLMAVAQHESNYIPDKPNESGSGATGMAQYMPATAKSLRINPNDPNEAIPAMAQQLRERLDKGYSMQDAVAEHFAGPDRKKWGEKTAAYGAQVLAKAGQIGQELYGDIEDAPAAEPTVTGAPAQPAAPDAGPEQNQFAPTRMRRADYLKNFKALNPRADQAAVDMAMAQYDKQVQDAGTARAKAKTVGPAPIQTPEQFFDARLNERLQGPQDGVVPQLPGRQQPAAFPETGTKHRPGIIDQAKGDFGRGIENLKALGYGVAGLSADAAGQDSAADKMLGEYVAIQNDIAKNNPATIGTYKNVHDLGDAGRYAVEAVMENLPMILPSLLTGGAGAKVAQAGAQRLVGGMIESQVAKGVAREVAEKNAAQFVARRIMMGSAAGAAPATIGMEAGSIMGDIYQETGQKRPGLAIAYGIPAGLLDTLEPVMALRKIAGPVADEVAGGIIKRLGVEAGKQFITEAGTEGLQTILEEAAKAQASGKKLMTPELLDNVIDSALKGGIGGAGMGVMSQGVHEARAATVDSPERQIARAIQQNVEGGQFAQDAGTVAAARMSAAAQDPNAITPQETVRQQEAVGPSPMTRMVPAPAQHETQQNQEVVGGGAQNPVSSGPAPGLLESAVEHAAAPAFHAGDDGFTAQIMGDDGQVHTLDSRTGIVESAPAAPVGPMEAAIKEAADQHAIDPAPMPAAPQVEPAAPDYTSMPIEQLRAELAAVASRPQTTNEERLAVRADRKIIEQEISARGKQAKADSKPAEEPLKAGPFEDMAQANRMMLRYAEHTGKPHEVVGTVGHFVIQPVGGKPYGIDPAGAARGLDGHGRSGEPADAVGRADAAGRGEAGRGAGGSERAAGSGTVEGKLPDAGTDRVDADGAAHAQPALNSDWKTNPYHAYAFPDAARAEAFMDKKAVDRNQFEAVQTGPVRWQVKPRAAQEQGASSPYERHQFPRQKDAEEFLKAVQKAGEFEAVQADNGKWKVQPRAAQPAAPAPVANPEVKSAPAEQSKLPTRDTRGTGVRFHGTSRPMPEGRPNNDYAMNGDNRNIYGQGFYTTDAADISEGYMRKGKNGAPTLYEVKERPGTKLFDMEKPMTPEVRKMAERAMGDYFPEEDIDGKPITTLREAFDEYRDESQANGLTRDDVQETFDAIRYNLENDGYHGYSHIGGLKTGKQPHEVRIYWTPEDHIEVSQSDIAKYKGEAADVSQRQEVPEEAPVARGAESTQEASAAPAAKRTAKPRTSLSDAEAKHEKQTEAVRKAEENAAKRKAAKAEAEAAVSQAARSASPEENSPQPAAAEAPAPTEAAEVDHNGTRIYRLKMKQGDEVVQRWAIESPENRERRANGQREIGGDSIHEDLDAAKKAADFERKQEEQAKARELEAAEGKAAADRAEAERKADTYSGFLTGKAPNQQELARKALTKQYRFNGDVMTVRERVDSLHATGDLEVSTIEEPKIKPLSRAAFNRASQREQDAHEKKMREAGTKTTYLVNGSDLGKTAYDYASHMLDKKAAPKAEKPVEESEGVRYSVSGDSEMARILYKDRDTILDKNGKLDADLLDAESKLSDAEFDARSNDWQKSVHVPLSERDTATAVGKVNGITWFHGSAITDIERPGLHSAGGLFMASERAGAEHYAGKDGRVYESRLKVEKPFFVATSDLTADMESSGQIKKLAEQGYDAIVPLDYGDIVVLRDSALSNPDAPKYSTAYPMADDAAQAVDPLVQSLADKGAIVLHKDASTLPIKGKAPRGVQALTTRDGTIHVVADALGGNGRGIVLHEAFHAGGEALIGSKEWGGLMGRLNGLYRQGETTSGAANAFWDAARQRVEAAKAKGAVGRGMEAEEFGAYAIEEYAKAPASIRKWVDDLVGHVKAWALARFGKQLGDVTPAQLMALSKLALLDANAGRATDMQPAFSTDRRADERGPDRRIHTVQVDGERRPIEDSQGRQIGKSVAEQIAFWRNYTGPVDEQGRPIRGDDASDERYSVTGATPPRDLTPDEQGLLRRVQSAVQDNMNRVRQVQDRISKITGVKDLAGADYYLAETNRPGRIAARKEDGQDKLIEPMMRRLAESGFKPEQLDELLQAQHAEERNKAVAKINPEFVDGGSGMKTAEANQIIARYQNEPKLQALADEARQIARETLEMKKAYGLITQAQYDDLATSYDNYVPLKGDGEYGPKVKRAMGHGEREEHIIENIARDFEQAIVVGEKNLARQSLLQMVLQYPDDNLWTARVPPKGRYVAGTVFEISPVGTRNVEASFTSQSQVAAWLEAKGAAAAGYEVNTSGGERVTEFTKPLHDNEVMVYVQGSPVRLQIMDDKLALQLRPLRMEQMSVLLDGTRKVIRWMSVAYTGYNPYFIPRNAVRDLMTGSINMAGNHGVATMAKAWAKYPAAWASMFKYAATGKAPASGKMGQYLTEYRAQGGKTGASYMSDLEEQGKTLQRMFDDAKGAIAYAKEGKVGKAGWIASRKAVMGLAHVVEVLNQAFENSLRLALYAQLREEGHRPAIAAQAAKNVTVNFDRKGSATNVLGAAYLFLNPAIQGTANMSKTLTKGEHKFQAWGLIAGVVGAGMFAALHGMDDDKDRWLGEKWDTRTKNFRMRVGNNTITVPVSQEYAPFYAAGVAMGEIKRGESKTKAAINVLSSFLDAYYPMQGAFQPDSDNPSADFLMAHIPTVLKLPYQVATNRNSFGSKIVPETDATKNRPDNLKMARRTKNSVFDHVAQGIADAGVKIGYGDKYENDLSKVSPETLRLVWQTYAGGLGRFITDTGSAASMALDDPSQMERGDIPFGTDFYKPDSLSPIRTRYFDLSRDAQKTIDQFQAAKKQRDAAEMSRIVANLDNKTAISLSKMLTATNKVEGIYADRAVEINADKTLTPAQKRAQLKTIEDQQEKIYRNAIGAFKN